MQHNLDLAYLISNNGDGSASIHWYESSELASWVEDIAEEIGDETYMWGESCGGVVSLSSDSPIAHNLSVTTAGELLIRKVSEDIGFGSSDDSTYVESLLDNFFDGKMPEFSIEEIEGYPFSRVYADSKFAGDIYIYAVEKGKMTREEFAELVNSYEV